MKELVDSKGTRIDINLVPLCACTVNAMKCTCTS